MQISEGTAVLFYLDARRTYLKTVHPGDKLHTHKGMISMDDAIGHPFGDSIRTHLGNTVILLEPTLEDMMMKIQRQTQIIYPKEAALIILKAGVLKGYRVLEVGFGSGALTMALANAVGDTGKVYAYDRREDRIEKALRNTRWLNLTHTIQFKTASIPDRYDESDLDAAMVDVPEPWEVVEPVWTALRGGGRWVSLSPTYNQVEKTAIALGRGGFIFLETIEILTRIILAREGRTRPFERMIGHTAFLTFARKINERRAEPVPEVPAGEESPEAVEPT
ncbi:MAG: tRNA (adenine-N1)-methyltransferase [Nitrospirae bacterium]|nr:tRNA (adenine-N1)-methyltransferase [Nitrospirota bacterium]